MEILTVEVLSDSAGMRLDSFLAESTEFTRSFVAKLCDEGNVTCKGNVCNKRYKVALGEVFNISVPTPELIDAVPEKIDLDIIYEDDEVLVVNKPQGMVVHPAPGNMHGTLVNGILYHCKNSLSGINGAIRPGIVHRIDKDTSGILVVAKTNEAHISLSEQWHSFKPNRQYLALVHQNIKEDSFTVDLPVGRSKHDRKKMWVVPDGRQAITHVEVIERFKGYCLVKCTLDTGRTHQIRVHMAYNHHPVVGDPVYGNIKEEFNLNGQLLHAQTLEFMHPKTGNKMSFSCPLPEHFQRVLKILRNR